MPSKNAAEAKRKQREAARRAGLCMTCCRQRPAPNRAVCDHCNDDRRQRERLRTGANISRVSRAPNSLVRELSRAVDELLAEPSEPESDRGHIAEPNEVPGASHTEERISLCQSTPVNMDYDSDGAYVVGDVDEVEEVVACSFGGVQSTNIIVPAMTEHDSPQCVICRDSIRTGDECSLTTCWHLFHQDCMEQLKIHMPDHPCPVCKVHARDVRKQFRELRKRLASRQ